MDIQETLSETIEAYLQGSLEQAELTLFEQKLKTDASLRLMVQRHRDAAVAINYHRHQTAKARLKIIDTEISRTENPRVYRLPIFKRIAVAASVLILIAAGMHYYAHQTYRSTAIAENLFVSSQSETYRGEEIKSGSIDEKFSLAEVRFNAGEYVQAKQIYLEILNEETILKDRAEWNLTLCLLAINAGSAEFITALDNIRGDPNHDYHTEAQKLYDTMQGMLYRFVNR